MLAALLPVLLAASPTPAPATIDAMVDSFVEEGSAVGVVLGFVTSDSTWVRGYGRVSRDDDRLPDGETIYDIATLTGRLTGMLVFDAISVGAMSLDHPISRYFLQTVTLPAGRQRPILLSDLVHDTSGLPPLPPSLRDQTSPAVWSVYGTEDLYRDLAIVELDFEPGTRAQKSLFASATLGFCLTRASTIELRDVFRTRLASRLGLSSTGFDLPPPVLERLAPNHDVQGQPRARVKSVTLQPSLGLLSNANDLTRLVQALIQAADSPWLEMCHYWWAVLGKPLGLHAGDWSDFPDDFVHGDVHVGLGSASALMLAPRQDLALIVLTNSPTAKIEGLAWNVLDAWREAIR